jgi:hypothetical protein
MYSKIDTILATIFRDDFQLAENEGGISTNKANIIE